MHRLYVVAGILRCADSSRADRHAVRPAPKVRSRHVVIVTTATMAILTATTVRILLLIVKLVIMSIILRDSRGLVPIIIVFFGNPFSRPPGKSRSQMTKGVT